MLKSDAGNVIRQTASIQSFTHPCTYILAAGLIQEKRLSGTVTPEAKKEKKKYRTFGVKHVEYHLSDDQSVWRFFMLWSRSNFSNVDPDNNYI